MPPIIHPTPNSLLLNGKPLPIGAYDDIIPDTSTRLWDRQGGLIKRRRTQRKAWVFAGAYTKDLMIGLAIVDAGYLANAFAYIYLPEEDIYEEEKVILPFGFGNDFDPGLHDEWTLRNFHIVTRGDQMLISCSGKFQLHLELQHNENGLSFICPTVDRPFNFTYKNLCMDTSARVIYKGKSYEMQGNMGGVDFSKGYPPRLTKWNWAMVSAETEEGIPLGLNLCDGHNGKYENALWLGEERILLPLPVFQYDRNKPLDKQDWHIYTEDGALEMNFVPKKSRKEKINAKLISHDFTQPFGKFTGVLRHEGKEHRFTGFGPVEEHESLW